MLSIPKIINYVDDETIELDIVKEYFEKGLKELKSLNKRSIKITQFIIVLIVLSLFQRYFNHLEVYGNNIDIKWVQLITPTLISYLLFEWVMMAKRRRDLIFGIQRSTYRLFKIIPTPDEATFPNFNPNTLNVMPYSLMCEVISIDDKDGYNRTIYQFAIKLLFIIFILVMFNSFYGYWQVSGFELHFNWPGSYSVVVETITFYITLLITFLFTGWVIYYYRTEFKNKNEILKKSSPSTDV